MIICPSCNKQFKNTRPQKYCSRKCSDVGRTKNIDGLKFGRLTALKLVSIDKNRKATWLFRCDCGIEKEINKYPVVRGITNSCGCLRLNTPPNFCDLTGKVFFKLTVLHRDQKSSRVSAVRWICRCECGTEKSFDGRKLTKRESKSCGCWFRDPRNPRYKGGIYTDQHGYVLHRLRDENNKRISVMEHRLVMAKYLGRPLLKCENVHHLNGIRDDNRIENLELWSTAQPTGQRVVDKVKFAREILKLYGELFPELNYLKAKKRAGRENL